MKSTRQSPACPAIAQSFAARARMPRHRRLRLSQGNRKTGRKWSGQQDSNLRPSAPKADALPGCAIPRQLDFCGLSGIGPVSQAGMSQEFGGQLGMPEQRSPGIVPEAGPEKSCFVPLLPRLCALGWFSRQATLTTRISLGVLTAPEPASNWINSAGQCQAKPSCSLSRAADPFHDHLTRSPRRRGAGGFVFGAPPPGWPGRRGGLQDCPCPQNRKLKRAEPECSAALSPNWPA